MNKSQMGAYNFSRIFEDNERIKDHWVNKAAELLDTDRTDKLHDIIDDRFNEAELQIFNSVRGKVYDIPATDLLYKIYDKPLNLVESGTLFINQDDELPPSVQGEMELYDTRREIKDKAIYYLTEGDNPKLGVLYNLQQQMLKLVMN